MEVLVVCIIVGILASLAIPIIRPDRQEAEDEIARLLLPQLGQAQIYYRFRTGSYYDSRPGTALEEINKIRANLMVDLPNEPDGVRIWDFRTYGISGCIQASQPGRGWRQMISETDPAFGSCPS